MIGQAEHTDSRTSSRWVITLLHEHFHQLQDSRPGNEAAVDAPGLARGDGALQARRQLHFPAKLEAHVAVRKAFLASLAPDDARYLMFQFWKEGIARYTEYRLADLAAGEYEPSRAFRDLVDYRSFGEVARGILRGIGKELQEVQLDEAKRSVVYSLGAAEGLVLDAADPAWRERYLERRFSLDAFFAAPPPG